ncbi:hypothetical protein PENSPDRAFT_685622 [Peniophora sp. CONT]|nr:hypothetical protein PENSPDRAFT_685622 [Peniophora sp. CONT]
MPCIRRILDGNVLLKVATPTITSCEHNSERAPSVARYTRLPKGLAPAPSTTDPKTKPRATSPSCRTPSGSTASGWRATTEYPPDAMHFSGAGSRSPK